MQTLERCGRGVAGRSVNDGAIFGSVNWFWAQL
jgi:hypothetical protein